MNLTQFADETAGVTDSDVFMHINAGLRSAPTSGSYKRRFDAETSRLQAVRDATAAAYRAEIAAGRIVEPTISLEERADGHPDNRSTQAARRLLERRASAMTAKETPAGAIPEAANGIEPVETRASTKAPVSDSARNPVDDPREGADTIEVSAVGSKGETTRYTPRADADAIEETAKRLLKLPNSRFQTDEELPSRENAGTSASPIEADDRAKIEDEISALVDKLTGGKAVTRVRDHIAVGGARVKGAIVGKIIHVAYLDPLSETPRNAGAMRATARHEVIHLLRDSGVLDGNAWTVLERSAATWRDRYDIDRRYRGFGLSDEALNEEAVAEAYAEWAEGNLRGSVGLARAFHMIRRFFDAVREVVRRVLGYDPDPRDVFQWIERGDFAEAGTSSLVPDAVPAYRAAADAKKFARELDQYLRGEWPNENRMLDLGETPRVFRALGLRDAPWKGARRRDRRSRHQWKSTCRRDLSGVGRGANQLGRERDRKGEPLVVRSSNRGGAIAVPGYGAGLGLVPATWAPIAQTRIKSRPWT